MINNDNASIIPYITNDQVNRLYHFTRKHFVEFYDLQTEMVDHLANGIEQQWRVNPNLSFEEALHIEFKKFGVFGFSDIVERRMAEMNKRYHKFVWQHFKEFFTIPKIIFTLSLVIILSAIFLNLESLFSVISVGFTIVLILFVFILIARNKLKQKKSSKKWLMQHVISNYGGAAVYFAIPFQIILHINRFYINIGFYGILLVSLFLVCWILYSYIMIAVIPKKSQEYLQSVYPEYSLTV